MNLAAGSDEEDEEEQGAGRQGKWGQGAKGGAHELGGAVRRARRASAAKRSYKGGCRGC